MKHYSFDYPHTCPKIDKAIGAAKDYIQNDVNDLLTDLLPFIDGKKANELSLEWSDKIYDSISDCFENVREANEDMRSAANKQIEDFIREIDDLKEQIKELESRD